MIRTSLALLALPAILSAAEAFTQTVLYRSGEGGYHTYRIPALLTTKKGTLLAFCEGRKKARSDTGNIDIMLRRSRDNGRTWSAAVTLVDHGPDTIGNPAPVQDLKTGTVWLLLTGNPGHTSEREIIETGAKGTRTVWIMSSRDDGATWSKPVEITRDVKPDNWTWYATGPVNGIQTRSGRLVIPCDHEVKGHRGFYSHVICSDDHGKTWKLGGSASAMTDESTVTELGDGTLMLNMRSNAKRFRRSVAVSKDGGITWSEPGFDETLIEPTCQASLIRYSGKRGKGRLLFSNPAAEKRIRMTVRVSEDEGKTWKYNKLVHEGPSAYSSLAALKDGTIGLLYEKGGQQAYETITFARFTLEWLTGPTPSDTGTPVMSRLYSVHE